MQRRAKKWQPWCSVASWYLWRACDLASGKQMTLPG
jgi:DNA-3-methyladenine glycosylase II